MLSKRRAGGRAARSLHVIGTITSLSGAMAIPRTSLSALSRTGAGAIPRGNRGKTRTLTTPPPSPRRESGEGQRVRSQMDPNASLASQAREDGWNSGRGWGSKRGVASPGPPPHRRREVGQEKKEQHHHLHNHGNTPRGGGAKTTNTNTGARLSSHHHLIPGGRRGCGGDRRPPNRSPSHRRGGASAHRNRASAPRFRMSI